MNQNSDAGSVLEGFGALAVALFVTCHQVSLALSK